MLLVIPNPMDFLANVVLLLLVHQLLLFVALLPMSKVNDIQDMCCAEEKKKKYRYPTEIRISQVSI